MSALAEFSSCISFARLRLVNSRQSLLDLMLIINVYGTQSAHKPNENCVFRVSRGHMSLRLITRQWTTHSSHLTKRDLRCLEQYSYIYIAIAIPIVGTTILTVPESATPRAFKSIHSLGRRSVK